MRPTAANHEVRKMRFLGDDSVEGIYARFKARKLSCEQAAEIIGISVSSFYRMRRHYEEDGALGLVDRRIGKMSAKRVPADKVAQVISLFKTRYYDFTVKHFHEKLPSHGITCSYTWVKNILQQAGVVKKAKKRGQHRRKRARKPMPGMMIHQDGSRHEWVPGAHWDLIVTMDDANSEVYSMFFCEEEGTNSSFLGFLETMKKKGLPCSVYIDRGSHYFVTDTAGDKVSKTHVTQVGRAMQQLDIEMIAAYSPQARGLSERMFGTLQLRLPQELRLRGITDMESANKFLREVYLPQHNARFMKQIAVEDSAFTPLKDFALDDILCIHEERRVSNDNTVRYKGKRVQLLEDASRCSFAKCRVRVHEYLDGSIGIFHGPRKLKAAILSKPTEEEVADYSDESLVYESSWVWQGSEADCLNTGP